MIGARKPRWSFMRLDSEDRPLGLLSSVTGGSGTIAARERLGGSASLTLDEIGQDIDWMRDRVQVIYDPGVVGVDPWPVGTYLFTSPKERHDGVRVSYDVGLLTKLTVLDEDTVTGRYTLPKGADIIPAVEMLIQSAGEYRIAVTESSAKLGATYVSEPDDSKLTVINDLLAAAGYGALWVDGAGQFRVEPYVLPADRPVAYRFEHGEASVHLPEWEREQNHSIVPNRFVVIGDSDETAPPMRGVAENTNPASPYSFQARGRWITGREEGFDGETQAAFTERAKRRLRDAMSPVSRLTASHAMLPLDPDMLVEFIPEDLVPRMATVQRMTFSFDPFTVVDAEWREVIPL